MKMNPWGWIVCGVVGGVAIYIVQSFMWLDNYKKEMAYETCVVNEFTNGNRANLSIAVRDKNILEKCARSAPIGKLQIETSSRDFLAIAGPYKGKIVCWKSSDSRRGINGTLWLQRDLKYR